MKLYRDNRLRTLQAKENCEIHHFVSLDGGTYLDISTVPTWKDKNSECDINQFVPISKKIPD